MEWKWPFKVEWKWPFKDMKYIQVDFYNFLKRTSSIRTVFTSFLPPSSPSFSSPIPS